MNIISKVGSKISTEWKEQVVNPFKVRNKQKIFCIGRNKTATTSLRDAFVDLGFITGNESKARYLLDDYIKKDFEPIIKFCKHAQVFKDIPFSLPDTYKYLDKAYPGSKFILTVRDSPEQWYNSVVKFRSKLFGNGNLPTAEDLKKANFASKGWAWKLHNEVYDTPESDIYNKKIVMNNYKKYNKEVESYFSGRNCLLKINVSGNSAYQEFCDFIEMESPFDRFPWKNKTSDIRVK